VIAELKQRWPQLPVASVEAMTLHYLSGAIDVELDLPIEILRSTDEAKYLVQELKQAVSALPYINAIQVRFKV
ncbi:MAG: hypothetical protein IPI17_01585, partial [Nitrosomonas sp.]|nr:hypothetical protein [Nitrosomonas sp.]